MHSRSLCLFFVAVLSWSASVLARGQRSAPQSEPTNGGDFSANTQPETKVPTGVILVKGAWSSASDSITPVPEEESVISNVFHSSYFGITYTLPPNWVQTYEGPPPSDSGRYVLAQIGPADTYKGVTRGSILITAEDMFFTPLPAANALELVNYTKENLQADHKVELAPTEVEIAGRSFGFFAYWSPVAQLHWYIVATQIRCHALEIVLTSRDTKLLESLIVDMGKIKLPAEAGSKAEMGGGDFPVCIKGYARDENVITRVDPVFAEHRFNPVPVRIIISKEGKVKHIHFLSAFPDQTKAITDALEKWKFRPYLRDGKPVEVETGIMFGRSPHLATPLAENATTE